MIKSHDVNEATETTSSSTPMKIFDGHNDVLLKLRSGHKAPRSFLKDENDGHLDWPRAKRSGFAGGLCAIYVDSDEKPKDELGGYPPLDHQTALRETLGTASLLLQLERVSDGEVKICHTAKDIRTCLANDVFAAVMHTEGIEAVSENLEELYVLHAAGLRSVGPVWSRRNAFAYGVPFLFPSSPDVGPGLSEAGKDLVRACNELKIMLDMAHMNEKGFWDVAAISDAPLVASHSNVHAICPHSRNVTDRQLDAIRETGGLIGINFGQRFLDPHGSRDPDMPLDTLIRHIDYVVDRIGIDHIALGSDFDGTYVPHVLSDVTKLPDLVEALHQHGYNDVELAKICHENWISVLERTWGA